MEQTSQQQLQAGIKSIEKTAAEINNHHHQLADGIKQNQMRVNKNLAPPQI